MRIYFYLIDWSFLHLLFYFFFVPATHSISIVSLKSIYWTNSGLTFELLALEVWYYNFPMFIHVPWKMFCLAITSGLFDQEFWYFPCLYMSLENILQPRPLSNDHRFTQFIYRYSHASKRFVEVYITVIISLNNLSLNVLNFILAR